MVGGRAGSAFRLVSYHGWADAELWSDAACAMCAFASRNSASAGSSRKSAVVSTLFFSLGQPRRPVLPCAVTTTTRARTTEPIARSLGRVRCRQAQQGSPGHANDACGGRLGGIVAFQHDR